jgi:hypothetical protein
VCILCVWNVRQQVLHGGTACTGRNFCLFQKGVGRYLLTQFLGAFAKLHKATISYVTSFSSFIRLSAWNNPAPTGRIFMKFVVWGFFENLSRKFKSY